MHSCEEVWLTLTCKLTNLEFIVSRARYRYSQQREGLPTCPSQDQVHEMLVSESLKKESG